MTQQTAETGVVISKVATGLQVGGGGTALYFGLTSGEWQAIGVIGGLVIGLIGLVVNVGVNFYFKHKHYKLAERKLASGLVGGDEADE